MAEEAKQLAKSGHSFFLLGTAGTGKTSLINEISKSLQTLNKTVAMTAATGLASSHLNHGTTIHKFIGWRKG